MAKSTEMCCLLIGRTGMGKSTTGNKLVGLRDPPEATKGYSMHEVFSKVLIGSGISTPSGVSELGEGKEKSISSTTKSCRMLVNNTLGIRVIDVAGFADSERIEDIDAKQANLSIMREIVRVQSDQSLVFNRILYFLPCRDAPEMADGNFREEIEVMHYFFGEAFFNSMVIVLTLKAKRCRSNPSADIDDEDKETTREIFLKLVQNFAPKYRTCPPLAFISAIDDGATIREKVLNAKVLKPDGLNLAFRQNVCSKCSGKTHVVETDRGKIPASFSVGGKLLEIEKSVCHPKIIPKYTTIKKVAGSVVILCTIGVAKLFGAPGFFNSEEICIKCRKPPGATGCLMIGSTYQIEGGPRIDVEHETDIPSYELLQ